MTLHVPAAIGPKPETEPGDRVGFVAVNSSTNRVLSFVDSLMIVPSNRSNDSRRSSLTVALTAGNRLLLLAFLLRASPTFSTAENAATPTIIDGVLCRISTCKTCSASSNTTIKFTIFMVLIEYWPWLTVTWYPHWREGVGMDLSSMRHHGHWFFDILREMASYIGPTIRTFQYIHIRGSGGRTFCENIWTWSIFRKLVVSF